MLLESLKTNVLLALVLRTRILGGEDNFADEKKGVHQSCCSVRKSRLTLRLQSCSTPGFPVLHYLPACMLGRFSHVRLLATLWSVACQAPPSFRVSRQEYWSGLPCPPPGDLPDPGIEPTSLMSPALAGRFFTTRITWEIHYLSEFTQTHVH